MQTPLPRFYLVQLNRFVVPDWRLLVLFLITYVSLPVTILAQNKLWDKTFGGDMEEQLSTVQQTGDGGYILGGSSYSGKSGDKTQSNKGYNDYWIVKLKANGTKEWDKTFGGEYDDFLSSIQQTRDGGYILAGFSNTPIIGSKTEAKLGYWIVKLKEDGSKEWDKALGGEGYDNLASLQQTKDGGYILGGSSYSEPSGQTLQTKGDFDYWLIKLKADGSKTWDKTIGGSGADIFSSLQQTSDGGYILGGSSSSPKSGDKSENGRGEPYNGGTLYGSDYWVVKVNAAGNKEWDKTIGSDGEDYLAALQQTNDGGYILGGTGQGSSSDKSEYRGYEDYWIVKLKANGTKAWEKTLGGDFVDNLSSVQLTSDGGYILGGYSSSGVSGDKSQASRGESDYWIVKLKADGSKEWDKTFGGSDRDMLTSLQVTSDNGYILGGSSQSGISDEKSQASKGGYDYWIVKLDNRGSKNQVINFPPIANKSLSQSPFTLVATASSGLPVSFKVVSGPATIKGNKITLTALGSVTVKASVVGNDTYRPAEAINSFFVESPVAVRKEWDKTIGGNKDDNLSFVQPTKDGGYILGGSSVSNKGGDKSEVNKGEKDGFGRFFSDYWIVKLNADRTKAWDKTIGGDGQDYLSSVQQTKDGGYILGGYSSSGKSGDKSQASKGDEDYWVVKLNADGSKVWDKTIGGSGGEQLAKVQQTRDGGYIVGGSSWSGISGDKTEANKGGEDGFDYADFWIIKLKPNGSKEWDKTLGGNNWDWLASLQPTSDGGYILGGSSNSDSSGDKSEDYKGGSWDGALYVDYWVIKLKADGTKEWDKTIGGNGWDRLTSLLQTNDGDFILGGWSETGIDGDRTKGSKGGGDYWIVKLDTNGKKTWDSAIGGDYQDVLTSLQLTDDGGYILGGFSQSNMNGDKSEANKGESDQYGSLTSDYWIVKLQEKQPVTAQWNMRYGGSGKDNFTTAIETKDGGYLSGGFATSGVSGDKSQISQGKNDYWVVKSDKNGKKLWEKSYGGSSDDYLNSMVQTSDGGYLLAGSSLSGIGGDKTQAGQGERDYWILKIDKQGTKLWDKTYGGSGTEELKKVILLPSGSFILAGTSNSPVSGAMSQESKGGQDYWFVKVNATGKKMWNKRYGGS
ncbi:hypothetical protein AHMF7605_17460 [Adhaeribacter arboris]|uniref:Secretion protein n=1 Tax=Adhaeribacter arboris TaxID=2072846 RepID=A0A2T2YI33_9BACT|nr:hypothetical protein [Adhaeribacter arboris]PSR55167.1 hypothetical protein AHMF7605_17460 [Adhaeribacter arboris]